MRVPKALSAGLSAALVSAGFDAVLVIVTRADATARTSGEKKSANTAQALAAPTTIGRILVRQPIGGLLVEG